MQDEPCLPVDEDLQGRVRCPFCPDAVRERVVESLGSVWAIEDLYPVTRGHHLIIPKRHTPDWFSMTDEEHRDARLLLALLKVKLIRLDEAISGYNIGANCGRSAGQTIFHAHIHLMPRRNSDTENPTGGVRGVIPGKRYYKTIGQRQASRSRPGSCPDRLLRHD